MCTAHAHGHGKASRRFGDPFSIIFEHLFGSCPAIRPPKLCNCPMLWKQRCGTRHEPRKNKGDSMRERTSPVQAVLHMASLTYLKSRRSWMIPDPSLTPVPQGWTVGRRPKTNNWTVLYSRAQALPRLPRAYGRHYGRAAALSWHELFHIPINLYMFKSLCLACLAA